jgi:uncharacterized membrane protein YqjE
MAEENGHKPGLRRLAGSLARAGVGILRNRGELFSLEWQEERARLTEMVFFSYVLLLLGFLGIGLLTAVIIFLFPGDFQLYVAGAFALAYLLGAVWAGLRLKSLLERTPFPESLEQLKKDRAWLESLK